MNSLACQVCNRTLAKKQKRYCSIPCRMTGMSKNNIGKATWNKGKTKADFPQLSNSGVSKGTTSWNKGLRGLEIGPKGQHWKLSVETKTKMKGRVPWNKGLGRGEVFELLTLEYKTFRKRMFIRDNYTCDDCGKRGGELQLDHIKPRCLYPELLMAENNVRTLCVDCHRKTKTFGLNQYTKQSFLQNS